MKVLWFFVFEKDFFKKRIDNYICQCYIVYDNNICQKDNLVCQIDDYYCHD
jgi:hypothetical protein